MSGASVDVALLTTGHDVADARLHRLVAVLLAQGLSVEVDGLGPAGAGPPGAAVRGAHPGSLARRALRAALLPWTAKGRVLLVLDPDLVLPALLRRWVARRAGGAGAGSVVVADVHEDYAKTLLDRSWATGVRLLAGRFLAASAVRAAARADLTLVADEHLAPRRPRSRLVVRNVPLLDMLPRQGAPDPAPRALYVGDVRRSRGLQMMLSVLEACPDWSLDVVGPVAAADRGWLARWRATSPARDRVTFHGRRPPREAWQLARGAWAGLCLLEPTPAFVGALPSKMLEYLACGLAVVTTPLPRAAALVNQTGAGAVAADVESAAAALRGWSAQPAGLHAHQAAARSWAAGNLVPAGGAYGEFGRVLVQLARHGEHVGDRLAGVEVAG